jgi:hypothetical protein
MSVLLFRLVAVALVGFMLLGLWRLSAHRSPWARGVAVTAALCAGLYSAFVAFALVAGNIGATMRPLGAVATAIFTAVAFGSASIVIAWARRQA